MYKEAQKFYQVEYCIMECDIIWGVSMYHQFGETQPEVVGCRFFRNVPKFLQDRTDPHPKKAAFFVITVVITSCFAFDHEDNAYLLSICRNSYYTLLGTSCRVQLVMHVYAAQDCEVLLVWWVLMSSYTTFRVNKWRLYVQLHT
jgi:hypothetical protein